MSNERAVSRRGFLRATAGAGGLVGATGAAAGAQEDGGNETDGGGNATDGGGGGENVRPDYDGWLDGIEGGYLDARGQEAVTVEVGAEGNGGPYAFAPANLWISSGTEVTFEWVSDSHNVVVESQPENASWTGHEAIENTDFTFSHTFGSGGLYEYFCQPHRQQGMLGGIAVGEDVPTQEIDTGGDGGGGGGPTIPDSAKTLGIASFTAMVATLGLGYVFLKYGGGAPEPPE